MVVVDVIPAQPHQMRFIQRDHMVQQLPAYVPDPAFGDAVLPRTPNAGPNSFYATGVQKLPHAAVELAVAVVHNRAVGTRQRKSLPQLLNDPLAGGMSRRVEMQN